MMSVDKKTKRGVRRGLQRQPRASRSQRRDLPARCKPLISDTAESVLRWMAEQQGTEHLHEDNIVPSCMRALRLTEDAVRTGLDELLAVGFIEGDHS